MTSTCYDMCCDEEFFDCLKSANPNDNVDLARCEYVYCDAVCLENCEKALKGV